MFGKKKLTDNIKTSFDNVSQDIGIIIIENCELRKKLKAQSEALTGLREYVERKFEELENNGVATAINKLNKEVFESKKNAKAGYGVIFGTMYGVEPSQEPTLAGKVDAIIEHLGIDVEVKAKEVIEAKAVAKKKPAPKKKGRK